MDNEKSYIYEIKQSLSKSPIRKKLINLENVPFKNVISEQLNKTLENINILENDKDKAVKLVIVGEVKSGKSSLVNALIGKEVSTVDVLEATSSIIEVIYDKENNIKKYDNIKQVRLNIEYLKKINIVDTPGLRSITIKNEQKTLNYINNADLILFVIDATHIGQEDILESLDLISQYRKPIVGILNKADLIEDDKDEVMEYIKDEYGIYIDDFFMISSYLEYQDKMSKNVKAGSTDIVISNYKDLKRNFDSLEKYIDNIIKNCEFIKQKSLKASIEGIIHKEIVNHNEYINSLSIIIEELKKYEKLLQNKFDYIKAKMEFEVNNWCNRVFFNEELNKIKEDIGNYIIYINETYINDRVNKKKIQLDELFFKEWGECLKEISEKLDEDIKKYIDDITYRNEFLDTPLLKFDDNTSDINEILATVGTGAVLGATSGGIISMYSAVIGSSAASVTIGTALMTYCPPLLIAGTVSGAIGKVIYDKIKLDKNNKETLKDIDEFVDNLKYKIAEELNEGYFKASQEIMFTTIETLKNLKGVHINKYEIEKLSKEIDEYIEETKKYISI